MEGNGKWSDVQGDATKAPLLHEKQKMSAVQAGFRKGREALEN